MDNKKQIFLVPSGLSEKSFGLWNSVAGRRASSPERLALLEIALRALDRASEASKLIQEQGLTTITARSGAIHVNPLVKIEREAWAVFVKTWHELGLRFDPVKPFRLEDLKIE